MIQCEVQRSGIKRIILTLTVILFAFAGYAQSSQYGTWSKSYPRDKWDDKDYSNPFIYTSISGKYKDLVIYYFRDGRIFFKIFDSDGDLQGIYSKDDTVNVSVQFNGQELGPVECNVTRDIIRINDEDQSSFATLLDKGNFRICIEYDSYTSHYSYVFNFKRPAEEFTKAAIKLLRRVPDTLI